MRRQAERMVARPLNYHRPMNFKFIFFILLSLFSFISCSDDDKDEISEEKQEDVRYYVKYEVYMGLATAYGKPTIGISYTSENGTQGVTTGEAKWEGTFGPIKKGTHLKISAHGTLVRNDIYNYVRLSVSRDKEPFVIKCEDRRLGVSSLSASYDL